MEEVAESEEFELAINRIRRYRPVGYQYVLDAHQELRGLYLEQRNARGQSPFFRRENQLRTVGIYQSMKRIGKASELAGYFVRPCCKKWPLIWPFCDIEC